MLAALERAGARVSVLNVEFAGKRGRCSSPSHRRRPAGTSTVPTARSTPTASPAVANNPERSRRVAEMWSARPDWSEKEILEAVDAQLAEEAEPDARWSPIPGHGRFRQSDARLRELRSECHR